MWANLNIKKIIVNNGYIKYYFYNLYHHFVKYLAISHKNKLKIIGIFFQKMARLPLK